MELKINDILQERGMKMSELATILGVDQSNLKRSLEHNPSLSRLEAIAKVLNVNVQDLFPFVPPVLTAGTLQMGDKYYTLIQSEMPKKAFVFNSGDFFNKVEEFVLRCIKEGKTISFCGLYTERCPFAIIYDAKSGRLMVSFAPNGNDYTTFVYEPNGKVRLKYNGDESAANYIARNIMNDFEELL